MAGLLLSGRRRRAWVLLGVIAAGAAMTVVGPLRALAADPDPDLQHARQQLAGLVDLVERLDEASQLTDALPISDLDPSSVLSGIVDDAGGAVDALRTELASAADTYTDPEALENYLDGLDVDGPVDILVGGPGTDDADDAADDGEPVVTKDATTDVVDIELSISVSKVVDVPIDLATGLVDLVAAGGDGTFPVTFSLETSDLHLQFDPAVFANSTTTSQSLALLTEDATPTVTLRAKTAAGGADLAQLDTNLGFTAIAVTGSVGFDFAYELSLVDPDDPDGLAGPQDGDGKITVDEMTSIAVADLVSGQVVDGSAPAVSASLVIDSDLYDSDNDANPVGDDDVTVSYTDASLTDGTPGAVSLSPTDSPLGDFRNFSATDALGAIARLVTMLDGLQNTGALDLSLPFINGWDNPADADDSPQGTFSDAIGLSGVLADVLTDPDTDGDGIPNADALTNDDLAQTIDIPGGESEIGRPTFENAQQLVDRLDDVLDDVLGEDIDIDLLYDAANKRLELGFPLHGQGVRSVELAFGDLDILSSVVTTSGLIDLVGSYDLDVDFALDLSTQPTEDGAGIGSCTDGVDNGAAGADIDPDTNEDDPPNVDLPGTPGVDESTIPLTDAGDPDCAGAQTLEQRVLVDVGDSSDTTPELQARVGVSATGVGANARIGLLEASIANGSLAVASPDGEDGDPADCANGTDDDADGATDADDTECQAALSVDLTDTAGDGWMTIESLLSQFNRAIDPPAVPNPDLPPLTLEFSADLAAAVRSTIPVSATLGGSSLGGGDIVVEGDYSGPVTGALDLIEGITVDASDVRTSDLFDFSPCSNAEDDDGDGTVNDGCDTVADPEDADAGECTNTTDDDGDGAVNDGCAPDDDPESSSGALFDKLVAALRQVAGVLEDTGVLPADTLDAPLPLIGSSFNDLVSFVDSLEGLADQTQDPGEASLGAAACTGSADDDGDGFVNDGCPTKPDGAGGLPEAGPECANSVSDDAAAGQFPDSEVNDGCPAVSPTLQGLSNQLATLLDNALGTVGDPTATTVAAPITYDPATKDLQVDFDIHFERTLATPLTLDLPEPLGSIVSLDDLSNVSLTVAANLDLGFGIGLDDFALFVATDSHLDVSATASGQDIFFSAGVGSLQLQVGQETPVPEDAATQCGDEVDSDGDGYANDGCDPKPNPEFGPTQCSDDNAGGDGKDDDGDGVADDGCGGSDPTTAGDPEAETGTECTDGDGADDDGDGVADDGCGDAGTTPNPAAAANPETGADCTGSEDGKDNDGDGFADDGCGGTDPATAGPNHPEGSATPSNTATGTGDECAIGDADPKDDDHDGFVNDGCEPKADRARFFMGAKIDVDVTNAGDRVALGDVTLGAAFTGTPQTGCAGVVIPADAHTIGTAPDDTELDACAVLPLYLDVNGTETPVRDPVAPADPTSPEYAHWATAHHVLFAIDELTDPTNVAVHFDTTALDDFIQGQLMDLLLMETGIGKLLDLIEDVLEADLLSFALPLIGGEGATAAGIVDDLRATIKAAIDETISGNTWQPSFTAKQAYDAFITPLFSSLNAKITATGLAGTGLTGTLRCDDGSGTLEPCDFGAENDAANPAALAGDGDATNNCGNDVDEDGDGTADDGCPDEDPAIAAVSDAATTISDVEINLNIGRATGAPASLPIDFDLGIPGFSLEISQGASLNGDIPWNLTFGVGLSKEHGFYFATHDGPSGTNVPELVVEPYVEISDGATMTGTLAFLQVDVVNTESKVDAKFTVDLMDPGAPADGRLTFDELSTGPEFSDVLAFAFQATADINLHIETGFVGGEGLPKLQADFELDWTWGVGGDSDQSQTPDPGDFVSDPGALEPGTGSNLSIKLDNVGINAGSFISNFLAPVFKDIGRFTDPLMPIIDTVTACIPVLSDLSGECTNLIDLAGFFGLVENTETLDTIVGIIQFANALKDFTGAGGIVIPLKGATLADSEFQLVGEALRGDTVTSNSVQSAFQDDLSLDSVLDDLGTAVGDIPFPGGSSGFAALSSPLSGITETLDSIHVKLPFLENPGKLLGILFGQDVDLILWEPPEFSFGFTYSQKFGPIWPTPPIFIEIGGSASFAINFGIGYDTEGFRNWFMNDQGPSALLQGLFLIDRHPLEGGSDLNELELRGELFANAQVSVLIFSAGAQGSVFMTIGVDLQDPNNDGKLKFNEAADIIRQTGNVLCIFNLNGEFGVRISVFAEVDLFFWSQRWEKILAEVILFAFKVECEPLPDPILAHADGSTLVLNMGDHRAARGVPSVGHEEINENFKVTRTQTGVTVSAFGITQDYPGSWSKILARAADGEDVIALADGKVEGQPQPLAFNIPADLDGGTGPDELTGSTVADELVGGDGDDVINGRDGANKVWGDTKTVNAFSGKDIVDTGKDHDEIWGGGGDDRLSAGAGADTVEGNDGKDAIDGGRGVAAMNGQPAVPDLGDTIFGDNSSGGQPAEDTNGTDDSDTIDGGDGNDFIYPSGGADLVNGGNGNDTIVDGGGDVACGAATEEDDVLTGGPDADTISAGNGNDIVVGGSLIAGLPDTGDTKLDGGNDCDVIFGDNAERPGSSLVPVDPGVGGGDTIEGGNGKDEIHGQVGDDTINGDDPAADDSTTDGNTGNTDNDDVVYGDEPDNTPNGVDTIFGDGGNDDLYGRGGADHMVGGLGDDEVFGEGGADVMLGDLGSIAVGGSVTLSGGAGNDRLSGGPQDDRMYGQGGRDDVLGDSGDDTGYGDGDSEANEELDKNDLLRGGVGDDHLFGNNGADDLFGEQGNDRLIGGSPNATSVDNGLGDEPDPADDAVGFNGSADDDPVGDDYGDEILGGSGADIIAGDNATITPAGVVTLLAEATIGQADLLLGEAADDRIFGENGDDRIYGGDGDDHAEGGDDADEIDGENGQDDLIGGTTEAADGGDGEGDQPDADDTIRGGDDHDVILGDNGAITRPGGSDDLDTARGVVDVARRVIQLYDVATVTDPTAHDGFAGEDDLFGDDDHDQIYGQGEDDAIDGGAVDDHLEGNAGNDTMWGKGGQDDIIGGTGRTKSDDPSTAVDGRLDEAEDIFGGDGLGGITEDDFDVIMGDNATVLRPDDPDVTGTQWSFNTFNDSVRRTVFLYDVAELTNEVDAATNGADDLRGEADADLIYGQGDADYVEGNQGDDYIEGNDGADTLKGQEDNDDVVGGTGRINGDPATGTDGRLDEGELLIQGGPGFDHIGGDNAIIVRVLVDGDWVQNTYNDGIQHEPIRLLDIATTAAGEDDKDVDTSGGDVIEGNADDDLIYGQGNDGSDPDGLTPVRDFLYGNAGDDYMEGNAGNDYMEGNADQDDMIGGTGLLKGDPAAGVNGRFDGNDEMHGGTHADFQLGDNGSLVRPLDDDGEWTHYDDYNPTTVVRLAARFDVNGAATTSGHDVMNGNAGDDYQWGEDGNDVMHGNEDNDDMYGELGDDQMFGDTGQDAMVGDRGGIVDTLIDGNAMEIAFDTQGPGFFVYVGLVDGQLDRRVSLTHDVDGSELDEPGLTKGGNDRMRGGPGHDSMHGAYGDDLMNGDSGGDWLFGADGADVMWGGKGADPTSADSADHPTTDDGTGADGNPANIRGVNDRFVDYLFGGHGGQPPSNNITQQVLQADILDYLPREADPGNGIDGDPPAWFEMTDIGDGISGNEQYHQGIDWIYGGFDRDVLEGDVGANGPDFGDRLIDWMGAYNLYTRCNPSYGDDGDIRQHSPALLELLQTMAYGSGAGMDATEVVTPGTSAYRELGLVYPGDKGNNGKAFPTTPGHFNVIDCTAGEG